MWQRRRVERDHELGGIENGHEIPQRYAERAVCACARVCDESRRLELSRRSSAREYRLQAEIAAQRARQLGPTLRKPLFLPMRCADHERRERTGNAPSTRSRAVSSPGQGPSCHSSGSAGVLNAARNSRY